MLISYASPAEVNLIFLILMVLIGVIPALLGNPSSMMKVQTPVYERICSMRDSDVIKWLVGIFIVVIFAAIWLQGQDTTCVSDGGGQFSYEVCE